MSGRTAGLALRGGPSPATSAPATRAWPEVGGSNVVSILMVVLLPAPLEPSSPNPEEAGTVIESPSTATIDPNRRVRRLVTTAGGRPSGSTNDPGLLSKQAVQDGERGGHLPQVCRGRSLQAGGPPPPRPGAQAGGQAPTPPRGREAHPAALPPGTQPCPPTT